MISTKKGIFWSAVERFSVQGSQFILSLILARLVSPSDFGLIAMLSIFMALAQVFTDSGFGNALIQKKDRSDIDYSTVFYFNIIISIVLYALLYIFAPSISNFYNTPQLTTITRIVGVNLLLSALCLIQKTIYRIELNFKRIAVISFGSVLTSGIVGIILASKGYGVWALVLQTLINNTLQVILFWITTTWHPILKFSLDSFRQLFSFGSKLLASNLLHTIFLNLYSLVIGKFYNPIDVGFYNRAYTISQYPPLNLSIVLSNVVYPIQCRHQDDRDWTITKFPIFIRTACYIIFPVSILLAITAKPLVIVILSERWIDIAPLITILSFAYMWIGVGSMNNNIINSSGRSDLYLKAEIVKKIAAIAILILTLPFGLTWLCIGLLIYNIIDVIIVIYFSRKIYPIGYRSQIRAIMPILILSLISMSFTIILNCFEIDQVVLLISQIFVFTSIYIIGSRVANFNELKILISFFRKGNSQ